MTDRAFPQLVVVIELSPEVALMAPVVKSRGNAARLELTQPDMVADQSSLP